MGIIDTVTGAVSSAVSSAQSAVSSASDSATDAVDTGTSSGSRDSGIMSWGDLSLPDWLTDLREVKDTLYAIGKNPEGFVLGTILAAAIGWVLDIFNVFFRAIQLVLIGSEPGYEPGQTIGIEDVFYIVWDIISDAGEAVGEPLVGLVSIVAQPAEAIAGSTGALSWPLTVGVLAVSIAVAYVILTKIGRATLAAIPIIGPFLEELLP